MSKTITSGVVTFMDITDNRRLDVYITSSLPNIQIKNPNTNVHTPDWTSTPLVLEADAYLDSQEVNDKTMFSWYKQYVGSSEIEIATNTKTIMINSNDLDSSQLVVYICRALYKSSDADTGIEDIEKITFSQTVTGINGADGTSIAIKGTAASVDKIDGTDYYTLVYNDSSISAAELGDSYLYDGDLYVCADSRDGVDYFINVGTIQGPVGDSAKNIILNADAQVFKINAENILSPSSITVTGQAINTSITEWTYSTDGGKTFRSDIPDGVTRNGDQVFITGVDITSEMLIVRASDGVYSDTYTVYKVSDGLVGNTGESASIAFLTNEHIAFSADEQGQIPATTITTNVVAYSGMTKTTPVIGVIQGLPDGITINTDDIITTNNELVLPIVVAHNSQLGSALSTSGIISIPIISPINTVLTLSWTKINTGATGHSGIDAVSFHVYSNNGYILSQNIPSITLQTFAYVGDAPIEAGASYQWYFKNEDNWTQLTEETIIDITDATTGEITSTTTTVPVTTSYAKINHTDVSFSCSYMCKMIFNGMEYVDVVTIDDKTDTNTVFTLKPTSYSAGDIWIVGSDYVPQGVETGTVLKAQYSNTSYMDSDWIVATKYDNKISELEFDVDNYKQYISLDPDYGIKMNAVDANGNASEFSTTLSNTQLSFNQANETIAYINNHKMYITEAEIESPLTVTGQYSNGAMLQAPTINLGDFSLVVESNGSFSIMSNL